MTIPSLVTVLYLQGLGGTRTTLRDPFYLVITMLQLAVCFTGEGQKISLPRCVRWSGPPPYFEKCSSLRRARECASRLPPTHHKRVKGALSAGHPSLTQADRTGPPLKRHPRLGVRPEVGSIIAFMPRASPNSRAGGDIGSVRKSS